MTCLRKLNQERNNQEVSNNDVINASQSLFTSYQRNTMREKKNKKTQKALLERQQIASSAAEE